MSTRIRSADNDVPIEKLELKSASSSKQLKTDVETHQLSDLLLPFDLDKVTQNKANLKHYHFLLVIFKSALEALEKKDYVAFDPAGDNLCQVRALWLALRINSFKDIPGKIKQIDQAILHIGTIQKAKNWENKSFKKLLDDNPTLRIDITFDESFLVQCFVVTKSQVFVDPKPETPLFINGRTENARLNRCSSVEISTNSSAKFIEFFRQGIAEKSAHFAHQLAVSDLQDKEASEMLSDKFRVYTGEGIRKRASVSCFWTFKVMSAAAFKYQLPLVMRCFLKFSENLKGYRFGQYESEVLLFLKPAVDLKSYLLAKPDESDLSRLVVVIEGISCRSFSSDQRQWERDLLEYDISEYMLYFAAAHKQYVNEKEDYRIANASTNAEYLEYREKNKKVGCSVENPSHFFINHVYCTTLGQIMGQQKKS